MSKFQGESQPQMWQMGQNGFGGVSTSDALNTRNNEILGKSGAMCDKISGIWRHYYTMMIGLVTGFYKKATSVHESFTKVPLGVCSARAMSNNCVVEDLV